MENFYVKLSTQKQSKEIFGYAEILSDGVSFDSFYFGSRPEDLYLCFGICYDNKKEDIAMELFDSFATEYTLEQLRELVAKKKAEECSGQDETIQLGTPTADILEWNEADEKRQDGNDGEVYKEPERMTGGYRDVGKSESVGMKDKYPKYYKDVSGLNEIDVYQIHNLFDIQDASGCLQHASKKLLLSGVRTGGKSKHDDIREARDTLTRWLDINSGQ